MNRLDTDYKTVISKDLTVHRDILEHSKGEWRLIKEELESSDRIVLVFSRMIDGEERK